MTKKILILAISICVLSSAIASEARGADAKIGDRVFDSLGKAIVYGTLVVTPPIFATVTIFFNGKSIATNSRPSLFWQLSAYLSGIASIAVSHSIFDFDEEPELIVTFDLLGSAAIIVAATAALRDRGKPQKSKDKTDKVSWSISPLIVPQANGTPFIGAGLNVVNF